MLSDHHARDLRFDGVGARDPSPAEAAEALVAALRRWAAAHPDARVQHLALTPFGVDGLVALLLYTDGQPSVEAAEAIAAAIENLRETRLTEAVEEPPDFV